MKYLLILLALLVTFFAILTVIQAVWNYQDGIPLFADPETYHICMEAKGHYPCYLGS